MVIFNDLVHFFRPFFVHKYVVHDSNWYRLHLKIPDALKKKKKKKVLSDCFHVELCGKNPCFISLKKGIHIPVWLFPNPAQPSSNLQSDARRSPSSLILNWITISKNVTCLSLKGNKKSSSVTQRKISSLWRRHYRLAYPPTPSSPQNGGDESHRKKKGAGERKINWP